MSEKGRAPPGTIGAVKAPWLLVLLPLMACPKAAPRQPLEHAVIVVAAGDISAPELTAQQLTATLVEQQQPAAVLVLGDSQYPTGSLEDFQRIYEPTWGRFKALTWPVPGNHEYKSGAAGYFAYFGARAGGSGARATTAWNLGDWHLVALNTNHDCENRELLGRRLRAGEVARGRPRLHHQEVRARVLAPPPLQLGRAWELHPREGLLEVARAAPRRAWCCSGASRRPSRG